MNQVSIKSRLIKAGTCRFAEPTRAMIRRRPRRGARVPSFAVVAALAALGVPGVSHPAGLAGSSPVLNWVQQAPKNAPHEGLSDASMAYDAATGDVVLFGGASYRGQKKNATWVWNGSTWTREAPKTSPPARADASMAYDAATGDVVLFGGVKGGTNPIFGDTWVWNGTNWIKQAPRTSPSPRFQASMAYDATTGNMILFGGANYRSAPLGDTWVWNGTNWIKQAPGASPPARYWASMSYDATTSNMILFGGRTKAAEFAGDTWAWDGSTWTRQAPKTSPPARIAAGIAYDAATGNIVLFGGANLATGYLADTWTWNGANWAEQAPTTSPPARADAAMAYDGATGNVVLFGGTFDSRLFNDTWTWGAT